MSSAKKNQLLSAMKRSITHKDEELMLFESLVNNNLALPENAIPIAARVATKLYAIKTAILSFIFNASELNEFAEIMTCWC